MNETKTNDHAKPKQFWMRKRVWIPVSLLAALLITGTGGVWYANSQARSRVVAQLSGFNNGNVEVGNVSLGLGGINATSVKLFHPNAAEPWLIVDELKVEASLAELVTDAPTIDRIEIANSEIVLDLDEHGQLLNAMKGSSAFALPGNIVDIKNADLRIRQPDRDELKISEVDLSLSNQNDTIQLKGSIGQFLNSAWNVDGSYRDEAKSFALNATSETFNVDSDRIARLPWVPSKAFEQVKLNGTASASAHLNTNDGGGMDYTLSLVPKSLAFNADVVGINAFINDGAIDLANNKLTFTNVNAKLGSGHAIANGSIDFNSAPYQGEYRAKAMNVPADELRQLAHIPENVHGKISGDGKGEFTIAGPSGFELKLSAKAKVADALYGEISTQEAKVEVEIASLLFDKEMDFENVIGHVQVDAKASQVAVEKFLQSFDLSASGKNLNVVGQADAKVGVRIPLETAADVTTWKLDVDAESQRLALDKSFLENVAANIDIENGFLNFEKLTGNAASLQPNTTNAPADQSIGKVSANGRWPLQENQKARFEIEGKDVSVEWLIGIAKEYSSEIDGVLKLIDPKFDGENSSVSGKLSVSAIIEVAPDDMQDVSKWNVTGTVSTGSLTVDERSIEEIDSSFKLIDGVFILERFKGKVPDGGSIELKATYPIDPKKDAEIDLTATAFPAQWLISLGTELSSEFDDALAQLNLKNEDEATDINGLISIALKLNRKQADDSADWTLATTLKSPSLRVRNHELRELLVRLQLTETELAIDQLEVSDLQDGKLTASGRWPLVGDQPGELDAQWMKIPLNMIVELAGISGIELSGTTTGDIHIKRPRGADDKNNGWVVNGQIKANDATIGKVRLDEIRTRIVTKNETIKLSQVQYGDSDVDLNLQASIATKSPHEFLVETAISDFKLDEVSDSELVREAAGDLPAISGIATVNARLRGTLQPFDFATSGDATIRKLVVDQYALDDVSAKWKDIGADLVRSRAVIDILGGRIGLREITVGPNHVAVDIENIDSEQLTSLLGTELKLTGRLSGDAVLDSWEDPEIVSGQLRLRGASTILGPVELGSLSGDVKYREQRIDYAIEGTLLDGEFSAIGNTTIPDEGLDNLELTTELKLVGADVNRLSRESRYFEDLRDLTGAVDADFNLQIRAPDFAPSGEGAISLRDMKYRNEMIVSRGTAELKIDGTTLVVDNLRADLAGGELSGESRYDFSGKQPGSYEISARRINVSKLGFISGDRNIHAEGYLDARIGGSIGSSLSGSGQISMERVSVYDIPGQSLRLPVQFRMDLQSMAGKFEITRSRFRAFDGQMAGKATIEFGPSFNVSASADLAGLDTGKMIGAFSGSGYDQGKLSGKVKLSGRGIRSGRDLQGAFIGKLERAQSFELPVLQDLTQFLNTGRLSQTTFDSNDIRIKLANGKFKIERFTFSSDLAQLLVTGSVSTDQRLNLDIVASIGRLNVNPLLERFAESPLTTLGGPTIALLAGISDFISDRVVYVHVGGTIRSPSFRLQTGLILRDETLQFFIRGTELQNILNNPQIR